MGNEKVMAPELPLLTKIMSIWNEARFIEDTLKQLFHDYFGGQIQEDS